MDMLEDLAWEVFQLTGDIREYLLYKNMEPQEENLQADEEKSK